MVRQLGNRQGRMINPLQMVLFFSALLIFIFTVVYRMVKSASLNNALATLFESLLILALFILLGVLLAYFFYSIYQKIFKETHRLQSHPISNPSHGIDNTASKRDRNHSEPEPKNKVES